MISYELLDCVIHHLSFIVHHSNAEEAFDTVMFGNIHHNRTAQVALRFFGLLPHQVANGRPAARDFSRASHFEPLLGAGMRLHLRHDEICVEKLKFRSFENPLLRNGLQK